MKASSIANLLPVAFAALLVVGVTALQGMWTERWSGRNVKAELKQAAELLETRFPNRFGNWEFVQEMASDPEQLERAGAVGHISRLFTNRETKAKVSAFIVCATPHDASGHTPDRCYPGAGFTIGEPEHRQTISLEGGGVAETFTGTFVKAGQTLRVFWTYGVPDKAPAAAGPVDPSRRWIAPGIARIALNGEPSVYKLYAIADQTRLSSSQAMVECQDFIGRLLPALNESFVLGRPSPSASGGESAALASGAAVPRERGSEAGPDAAADAAR